MKRLFTFAVALIATLSVSAEQLPLKGNNVSVPVSSAAPLEVSFSDAWGTGVVLTGDLTFKRTEYPKIHIVLSGIGDEAKPMGINVKYDGASDKAVTTASKDGDEIYDLPTDVDADITIKQLLFRSRSGAQNVTIEYFALIDNEGKEHSTTYKISSPASTSTVIYSGEVTFNGNWAQLGNESWALGKMNEGDYGIYSIMLNSPYAYDNLQMLRTDGSSDKGYINMNAETTGQSVFYYRFQAEAGTNITKFRIQRNDGGGTAGVSKLDVLAAEGNINKVAFAIPESGYATFCYDRALDLTTLSEGAEPFAATKVENGALQLTSIAGTTVQAYYPFIIKGKAGVYTIALSSEEGEWPATKLKGNGANNLKAGVASEGIYQLDGDRFVTMAADYKAQPYSAWLSVADAPAEIPFATGTTTAITDIPHTTTATADCFNMAGQRVAQPTKGLYIVGGRKVVIR